jgi:outer membrane protein TolC
LRERPELASSRAAIAEAHAQERLARALRIPDLGLFAAEMHMFRNPAGVSDFLFARSLIPIARQAVESGRSSYAAGKADFTMVPEAARDLRTHEMNLAMHLASYEQRFAELQRAVGSDLGLQRAAEGGHEEHH